MTTYQINLLETVKTVHDNMSHIQELHSLLQVLSCHKGNTWFTEDELEQIDIIIHTTINSHYQYGLFTWSVYQNPENHIDRVLEKYKAMTEITQGLRTL